jgi:hypothetical protein
MKFVESPSELWRADDFPSTVGTTGDLAYSGAEIKYFTTTKDETTSYLKRGPFQKKWIVNGSLRLLDILDPETRKELYESAPEDIKSSMNTSFPIDPKSGNPYRVSEEGKTHHDYAVLKYICAKEHDGYYMALQDRQGIPWFHSEVGLCERALKKLTLADTERGAAPQVQGKRRRPEYSDSPPSSPVRTGALFGGRKKKNTRRKKKFRKTRRRTKNGVPVSV